jgi:hypothetical protein
MFILKNVYNTLNIKEEPPPLVSKFTGGKKKPLRQSLDKNGSHEKIVYRERVDSQVQMVSLANTS